MADYNGGPGVDLFVGGNEDDVVTNIGESADVIVTSGGNDTVTVIPGLAPLGVAALVEMGIGDDHLIVAYAGSVSALTMPPVVLDFGGVSGSVTGVGLSGLIFTGADRFTIDGSQFGDAVNTGGGSDRLYGNGGDDVLNAGAGSDILRGGLGADALDGGANGDFADYGDKVNSVVVTLNGAIDANVTVGGVAEDTVKNIENVYGGTAGDILTGDGFGNYLFGDSGNDILRGAGGSDTLRGGLGADTLDGGAGGDFADYRDKSTSVDVTLNGATNAIVTVGGLAEDTVQNIENIYGGSGNDTLTGDHFGNLLSGGGGTDVLRGSAGEDTLDGGANGDFADYGDKVNSVSVTLNGGNDALVTVGGVAEDTIRNIENVYGGTAGDVLRGDNFNNYFYGHLGNDLLSGGGGNDTLVGAAGADTFRFNAALNAATNLDHITDFAAEDTIHLDDAVFATLAAGALAADAFHSGAGATAGADLEDRIVYNTTTGALYYDSDGLNGVAAVQFADLDNNAALTSADFFVV